MVDEILKAMQQEFEVSSQDFLNSEFGRSQNMTLNF
jgi:hypothetical protein